MKIHSIIQNEIAEYLDGQVAISYGHYFSQESLVRRIMVYLNGIYTTGKLDSQGNYKYWFDIISPRINTEVKNVDFDTKDIILFSDKKKDNVPVFLANTRLKEWMNETGQATSLNEAVEDGTAMGNVVFKKTSKGYQKMDLRNFFVINQTAKTLGSTPVIERHIMNQSGIRKKRKFWDSNIVDKVLDECGEKTYEETEDMINTGKETESLYYTIYERNGEITERDLLQAQGIEDADNEGDENKYVLAKIIVAAKGKDVKYTLFAKEIKKMSDIYKEYHRGRYQGRWFRVGMVETLFDVQTRINELGNQIARGMEWASKVIFKTTDTLINQNIMTEMVGGEIIKAKDISQLDTKLEGFSELATEWNRLITLADALANSTEVIRGESLPSGTPFRLAALTNLNANKLFDFYREKLGLTFQEVFQEWILPDLIKDLKSKDVLRITGDEEYLKRFRRMVVDGWYVKNLLAFPPHTPEQATALEEKKMMELAERPEQIVKLEEDMWQNFKPRVRVVITGESVNLTAELETLHSFISLEQDPVRKTALIEWAMRKKGIDVSSLPKSSPEALAPPAAQQPLKLAAQTA